MRALACSILLLAACHDGLPLGDGDAGVPCAQLTTQADCHARTDCVADTCLECTCTPTYVACRAKSAPQTTCPGLGCASRECCRSNTDCAGTIGQCESSPFSEGCGICDPTAQSNCTTDTDCPNGICDPIPCGCTTPVAMTCQPGCSGDGDCEEPQTCGTDKRCHARACDATCTGNYECGANSVCVRKSCSGDGDCATPGYCVNGQCSSGLGECIQPAA
jgi:hypothetical protein